MISGPVIYKRDSAGKTRVWNYLVDEANGRWAAAHGIAGGAVTTDKWTVCKPKSQPTPALQASFEATAEMNKKLKREYRQTIAELDSVPPSVMLAQDFNKQKKVPFPGWSQPKLDGIRSLTSRHGGFSREYQPHLNIDHILEELRPAFEKNPNLVLDGELYNHDLKDDFNKITSVVRKQDPTEEERAEAKRLIQYHIYDVPSVGNSPFRFRAEELWKLSETLQSESIRFVETLKVGSKEDLDAAYVKYLEAGYEGQMYRTDDLYEFDKRSKFLLKRKEFITQEFPISRVIEGVGNWAGYAKAVEFILPDDKRLANGERPKAGIRGSQADAKELLAKTWGPKATTTIRFFTPTPDGIPRFPVAIDFHPNGRRD